MNIYGGTGLRIENGNIQAPSPFPVRQLENIVAETEIFDTTDFIKKPRKKKVLHGS